MADKTVVVRLRAVVGEYQKAMAGAAASTKGVAQSGKGLMALGPETKKLGGELTRNVTLPILAIGAAAGKMSYDFEATFARMQGLAGVSAKEVDGLKESVLDLAGETARSPQELAEGLYFVRSAGIEGAAALDTLETSAKAATAGLGSTAAVADAVTSALNAYGEANITAAEAGDILAATAREGKAEASELAPQFGRLLPIAAELGVEFHEVGAGMAFLSRSSGDAALSATQLNGVLEKMLNPSEEGAEALAAIGSSAAELRQSVADNGLLPTLTDLRDNLEANGLTMADFSRDNQFLQGALQLTGVQAEEAEQVFASLSESSGSLGEAFGAVAETDGFKMKQALTDVQVALIKLGDIILPLVATVATFGAAALTALSSLPGPLDTIVVGFLAMAAALGPILKMSGPLVTAFRKVGDVIGVIAPNSVAAAGGIGQVGRAMATGAAAVGLAVTAWQLYEQTMSDAKSKGSGYVDDLRAEFEALGPGEVTIDEMRASVGALNDEINRLSDDKRGSQSPFDADYRATLEEQIRVTSELRSEQNDLIYASQALAREMGISEDAAMQQLLTNDELKASVDPVTGAFDAEAAAVGAAVQALQDHADALHAQFDPVFAMQDALANEKKAHDELTWAIAEHGASSAEAAEAEQNLFRSVVDTDGAALSLKAAMEAGTVSIEDGAAMLDSWVTSGRLTKEQADRIATAIGITTWVAGGFAGTYTAKLEAQDNASAAIQRAKAWADTLDGRVVDVVIRAGGRFNDALVRGSEAGGLVTKSGGRKPGPTDTIPMLLAPGEFVLDAATTARLGVPYLNALNGGATMTSPVLRSRPQLASSGGQTIVHHHHYAIHASSIDAHTLGRTVRDALEAGGRRGVAA